MHTGSRGMSKRLASIVRRSPCYPFHGSPRDSFVRGNPLLTKFNIPAAQYALEQHQKGAQSENLRATYRRNSWHRGENSFAIEARRLFSMQFDEPSDRSVALGEQIGRMWTACFTLNRANALPLFILSILVFSNIDLLVFSLRWRTFSVYPWHLSLLNYEYLID